MQQRPHGSHALFAMRPTSAVQGLPCDGGAGSQSRPKTGRSILTSSRLPAPCTRIRPRRAPAD